MRNSIFLTPSEPIFNLKSFSLSPDLLEESLHVLAEENEKAIGEEEIENYGIFKEDNSAEFVFRVCNQLNLPPAAKYMAVELLDKFMVKHIRELYSVVRVSSCKDNRSEWENVMNRLKEQFPLRAISCIQLASKLVSHYKSLTPPKSRRLLASFGFRYTTTGVAKSEIRILKALDFKVATSTPLTFIETLLEVLGMNMPAIKVKLIHDVGMKILDIFYLKRREILIQLCECASSQVGEATLSMIGTDYLLLATAIIVAASFIIQKDLSNMVVVQMVQITKVEEDDMTEFANILVKEAIESRS